MSQCPYRKYKNKWYNYKYKLKNKYKYKFKYKLIQSEPRPRKGQMCRGTKPLQFIASSIILTSSV